MKILAGSSPRIGQNWLAIFKYFIKGMDFKKGWPL